MEQEQENDHQQRMTMLENDRLFLESQTKISLRGLAYLFVLVLILLLSGVLLLAFDKDVAGSAACILGICAMLRYFSPFVRRGGNNKAP